MVKRLVGGVLIIVWGLCSWVSQSVAQEEVNLYSARKEVLITPQLEAFTAATGIKVNLVAGKGDALLERLIQEGANSPADVLLTVDVGRLIQAVNAGVTQGVDSDTLSNAIPPQYRDPLGHWFGLGLRSRVIYYAPDRVDVNDLSTYEDLADAKWQGKICIRSSTNIYNQSLLSSIIARHGEDVAEDWAAGVVANMARDPQGGDTDQIKAVAAGECDISVGNTYYYARLLASNDAADNDVASKVKLFWPNQNDRGAHVNISGATVTKSSKNTDNAIKLIEFLVSEESQKIYAEVVFEYPIRAGVELSDILKGYGAFKADTMDLNTFAVRQADAIRVFDKVGWR